MNSQTSELVFCMGCGAIVPSEEGATHRYLLSAPGCWAIYGEVLAREYSDFAYGSVHRLTVDAYAVQHPGQPSPQSIQSIALHLSSLYLVLEAGYSLQQATAAMQQLAQHRAAFFWLTPPDSLGEKTVVDVWMAQDAATHRQAVWDWARSAWRAWEAHHTQVREWSLLLR